MSEQHILWALIGAVGTQWLMLFKINRELGEIRAALVPLTNALQLRIGKL